MTVFYLDMTNLFELSNIWDEILSYPNYLYANRGSTYTK